MPREYGNEFPERPLMGTVSDLLGIPHFTTSRGSTVRRDFLEAAAAALQVPAFETLDKDGLIRSVWEAATGRTLPPGKLSIGGTVTNEVLQDIVDGVTRRGVPGRPFNGVEAVSVVEGAELVREPDDDLLPRSDSDWVLIEDDSYAPFDPENVDDQRDRQLVEIAVREGQNRFRTDVLTAYGHRCAITGYDAASALQAAHIQPYRGTQSHHVTNGLCLRADLHVLFDRGEIAIDDDYKVILQAHLLATRYGDELRGVSLNVPRQLHLRPSLPALRSHRIWAGLA